MADEIHALKELLKVCNPDTWKTRYTCPDGAQNTEACVDTSMHQQVAVLGAGSTSSMSAEFIAKAKNNMPLLLQAAEHLESILKTYGQHLQEHYDDFEIANAQGVINQLRDVESQFEFTVTLSGVGTTPAEAYKAAVGSLAEYPGEPQVSITIRD